MAGLHISDGGGVYAFGDHPGAFRDGIAGICVPPLLLRSGGNAGGATGNSGISFCDMDHSVPDRRGVIYLHENAGRFVTAADLAVFLRVALFLKMNNVSI